MREITVQFRSFRDVREFAAIAARHNFPITVGTDRYQVNADSVLGMFTLNCRKPLDVRFSCTEEEYQAFLRDVAGFLAE